MQKLMICLTLALLCAAVPALAELQNVQVDGTVRIRGNYVNAQLSDNPNGHTAYVQPPGNERWGAAGANSIYAWNSDIDAYSAVEQRTRLGVKADFTDNVSSYIEFDNYNLWGEDFRSKSWESGIDNRSTIDFVGPPTMGLGGEVEVFQAYIETNETFGVPLRLRIGRQELKLGSQWLVGANDFAFFYSGLSFDAIRATWTGDGYSIDAWASKVQDNVMGDLFEKDENFYGVYASCTAVENWTFDLYWMLLDDDSSTYPETTELHTFGGRVAGNWGPLDWDVEAAYQVGDAGVVGAWFGGLTDVTYDNLGLRANVGYGIAAIRSRAFVDFRYYEGEDNRDQEDMASVSFNRLFSNDIICGFFDPYNDFSNGWYVRLGLLSQPMPKIKTALFVSYYAADGTFTNNGAFEGEDELGIDAGLFGEYLYSEDLTFEIGWTHLFPMDGLDTGNYVTGNGLILNAAEGGDADGSDYIYGGVKISF